MAISSPESSCGERTSTSTSLFPRARRTSSRPARIESSPGLAVNVAAAWSGSSLVVGRPSTIHFSRGPLMSLTLSCP
jgi:hypothetical protein